MNRDIFILNDGPRFEEFLKETKIHFPQDDGPVGVGFFSAVHAMPPAQGVEMKVAPPFLKSRVLQEISRGNISPFEQDVLFFGEGSQPDDEVKPNRSSSPLTSVSPVFRWLLVGLQTIGSEIQTGDVSKDRAVQTPVDHQRRSVSEIMTQIFSRILELRASCVIYLLDMEIFSKYFPDDKNHAQILGEILAWIVEDGSHPNVCLVCENKTDLDALTEHCRSLVLNSTMARNVSFRL